MPTLYFESELYHHGVKGMKWGVRRYQNKDGTLTPAGKKRLSKAGRDAEKLSRVASKYYDAINDYNLDIDIMGSAYKFRADKVQKAERAAQKLVKKLEKKYASVSVIPTYEKNGYVVKSIEAMITKMDRQGRVTSVNKSFRPVNTYRDEREKAGLDNIARVKAANAKHNKRLSTAKTEEERAQIEFDWLEELDQ